MCVVVWFDWKIFVSVAKLDEMVSLIFLEKYKSLFRKFLQCIWKRKSWPKSLHVIRIAFYQLNNEKKSRRKNNFPQETHIYIEKTQYDSRRNTNRWFSIINLSNFQISCICKLLSTLFLFLLRTLIIHVVNVWRDVCR